MRLRGQSKRTGGQIYLKGGGREHSKHREFDYFIKSMVIINIKPRVMGVSQGKAHNRRGGNPTQT